MKLVSYPTNKAIWMPLAVQSGNVVFHDGPIAARTLWCKHIIVIGATIRFAVTFMEPFLAKLVPALSAEKVLCVPRLLQSCHTFLEKKYKKRLSHRLQEQPPPYATYIQNRTITVGTTWTEQIMIIWFTIRKTVPFKKVTCTQLLVAMVTRKVLWMPGLAQSGDHLSNNWFVASVTTPLLGGIHPLTAHFGLQTAQHRIQLITTVRILL
jgi:hypothetical protein